jgi:hypothetical protein
VRAQLARAGYELHEFRDNTDDDRLSRLSAGALNSFEGQIVFPRDDGWKPLLIQALRAAGQVVVVARLDDEEYELTDSTAS